MKHTLRRWSNPRYRKAHRQDLPSVTQVLTIVLCIAVMAVLGTVYDAANLRQEKDDAQATTARVLGCLNGRTTLGSFEEGGKKWIVLCSTYYKETGK